MKRTLRLIALLLCLSLLLSACGGRSEKEAGTEAPAERHRTARQSEAPSAAAETPAPAATEEPQPYTEPPVSTPAPAVRVEMTRQDNSEGEHVFFSGISADGETVWQAEASTDYRTELTLIEEIGLWRDRYYFNDHGAVVCLRLADGEELWRSEGFGGASISSLIDERNGNVYLCGWYGPDFFACSCEGQTLADYRTVAEGFYWPGALSWVAENEVVFYYHGGLGEDNTAPCYVDLTDYSIFYNFGFEDLDADSQYWANIFVSDFAEQFISKYPQDGGSDAELSSFARLFCKINRHSAIVYEGGCETVSLDTVNELCLRFFGREIHPAEGAQYKNDWGMEWIFENGRFRFPASDGEAYNRFAVVRDYLRMSNGDVQLSFDVYELSLDEYWSSGMDSSLYYLTAAGAEALAQTGRIARVGSGTALTTPIEQNGHDGYYLHNLHIDPA